MKQIGPFGCIRGCVLTNFVDHSNFTSRAASSCRNPSNDGWRRRRSAVQVVKAISATGRGSLPTGTAQIGAGDLGEGRIVALELLQPGDQVVAGLRVKARVTLGGLGNPIFTGISLNAPAPTPICTYASD
jgi:hypothetical protein